MEAQLKEYQKAWGRTEGGRALSAGTYSTKGPEAGAKQQLTTDWDPRWPWQTVGKRQGNTAYSNSSTLAAKWRAEPGTSL